MTKHSALMTVAVPAALLAVGAVVAARKTKKMLAAHRATSPPLELTAQHRSGTGSPLLLIHGVGSIWRAWSPVLPHLEAHHDVIVPTLSGHGGGAEFDSTCPPTISALADTLEAQLDQLGIGRTHIAGNSLGGWLGIELARRGRARSLVLFSPAGAWRSQRSIEMRASAIALSVGALGKYSRGADLLAVNPAMRWLMMAPQVAYPDRFPADLLSASIRASAVSPVVAPLLREITGAQVAPLPADHDYPVRLVWGKNDRVLPYAGFGEPMLRKLPGAELILADGFGHVPMTDDPVRVAQLILTVTSAVDATPQFDRTGSDA